MLVNLLPGLREIRGPLAAGYVVLGVLWASFVGEVPTSDSTGVSGLADDLKTFGGAAVLGAVTTFVAYVVGSIATDATRNIYRFASIILTRKAEDKPISGRVVLQSERRPLELTRRGSQALTQLVWRAWEDAVSSRSEEGAIAAARDAFGTSSLSTQKIDRRIRDEAVDGILGGPGRVVDVELQHQTAEELDLVKTRLLGREPELFGAVDRLRGEHELRLALAFSCVVLTIFFLIKGPWWAWVASALVVPILAAQAIGRRRVAGEQLIDALSIRRVQAPTLERFLQLSGVSWAEGVRETVPSDPEQSG